LLAPYLKQPIASGGGNGQRTSLQFNFICWNRHNVNRARSMTRWSCIVVVRF